MGGKEKTRMKLLPLIVLIPLTLSLMTTYFKTGHEITLGGIRLGVLSMITNLLCSLIQGVFFFGYLHRTKGLCISSLLGILAPWCDLMQRNRILLSGTALAHVVENFPLLMVEVLVIGGIVLCVMEIAL